MGDIISAIFQVLTFAVFARALMSWFRPSPGNPLVQFLVAVTEPILAPLRLIIPRIISKRIDITPMVAIVLLQLISGALARNL